MSTLQTPKFIYGTAWKEDRTEDLVFEALESGFTAIDTANQRKHYYEEGVGKGIKRFLDLGKKKREEIFIQTKFTFARGQDHRKPYDENSPYEKQVFDSFASSLQHLNTTYLDSYILHGPFTGRGLTPEDWHTWTSIETLYLENKTKLIGVSNFNFDQLEELYQKSKVKPHFIQNRCFAALGWDKEIRDFCRTHRIHYQGFSLLTANLRELAHPEIISIARKYQKSLTDIVFKFSQQIGMIPLTGTTDKQHMAQDLKIEGFELSPGEIETIEGIGLK